MLLAAAWGGLDLTAARAGASLQEAIVHNGEAARLGINKRLLHFLLFEHLAV